MQNIDDNKTVTNWKLSNDESARSGALVCLLAERTGLEPATPGVTGRYSNQLNYRSVIRVLGARLVGAEGIEPPTFAV